MSGAGGEVSPPTGVAALLAAIVVAALVGLGFYLAYRTPRDEEGRGR